MATRLPLGLALLAACVLASCSEGRTDDGPTGRTSLDGSDRVALYSPPGAFHLVSVDLIPDVAALTTQWCTNRPLADAFAMHPGASFVSLTASTARKHRTLVVGVTVTPDLQLDQGGRIATERLGHTRIFPAFAAELTSPSCIRVTATRLPKGVAPVLYDAEVSVVVVGNRGPDDRRDLEFDRLKR